MSSRKKRRTGLSRGITLLIILLAAMLVFSVVFIVGTLKYNVVRLRFSLNFPIPEDDVIILEFFAAAERQDLNEDTWYYEKLGGVFNALDLNNNESNHAFYLDYYQRLLIESTIEEIVLVAYMYNLSMNNHTFLIVSDPISIVTSGDPFGNSVQIVVDTIDIATREITYTLTPQLFLLEPFVALI